MSYLKLNSRINNNNDDINIYKNKNLNLELQNKNKSTYNIHNSRTSSNLNFQNKSSNFNKINGNEKFSNFHANSNFSSSLKDQILSPGDDDISPKFNKNKKNDKNLSPYLDDDIVFNQLNFHYLNKNKNNLSLIDEQTNQNNEKTQINIDPHINKEIKNEKKTLILDLDETLVHSSFKPINYNNIPHKPDIFLTINFRNNNHNVFVLKRPYVHEFLKEMNKFYNIVIFTASVKEYANPLLDTLDTEKVIKKRLFREDCCIGPNGKYVKNLKVLNMNLKDLILVDNNPISYSYNKCNGVPIQTWHFDKTDQELIKLIPVLQFLADVNDVRSYIPKLVENDEIDFSKMNYLINELNNENQQNKQKPRAKSQTKFMASKRSNNRNSNYGINNNLNKNNINNLNINNKKQIFEETKVNLEMNKNNIRKYDINQNINSNNIRPIKQINNNKNSNEEYKERNVIDFNHTNKCFYEHNNNTNFNFNNYLNETNTFSKNNNSLNIKLKAQFKEKANFIKKEEEFREQTAIESYKKKYNILSLKNNYLINECRNYQRNKTQDISKMKKTKNDDTNTYMNNYQNNEILNNHYNLDTSPENNNIKSNCNTPNLNENIKNNYANKFEDVQNKENNNNNGNYIHNYKNKINYTYTTPQINKKYMSNFKKVENNENINTIFNYNQNNININIDYKKNLIKNNLIKNNNDKNNNNDNNLFYINNTNNINGEDNNINSFNRNNFYKDIHNEFNQPLKSVKENGINKINNETPKPQKSSNKVDLDINNNGGSNNNNLAIEKNDSIKDFNIMHSNTAINFFPSKFNSNNMYNDILSHNLYDKEESKINNMLNNGLTYLKLDNNLKRQNSPYKISKETNYYIKRKMKLNKEKILNKNKDKEKANQVKNDLYIPYNGIKGTQKSNYLNGVNNFIYNINQKYYGNGNENYFYVNNNY